MAVLMADKLEGLLGALMGWMRAGLKVAGMDGNLGIVMDL